MSTADKKGPKVGDSASLWNFTLSPAFTGLQVDVDKVREHNAKREDVVRKNGLIINTAGNMSSEEKAKRREENINLYGLTPEQIAAVVLREAEARDGAAAKADATGLSRPAKIVLLLHLRRRLQKLGGIENSTKEAMKEPLKERNSVDKKADQIVEMGFTRSKAMDALQENGGDLESAVNWLFVN
eukprot:gene26670-32756_t